jgi:predicted transcriptional regulator
MANDGGLVQSRTSKIYLADSRFSNCIYEEMQIDEIKREYEKKFEGTDIEYLIREKIKEGFTSPKILEVMKNCLYTNVEKRIDLVTLY